MATYLIVAWRLLWLTYEARLRPEGSWAAVLDATEQEVLRRRFHWPSDRSPPTVGEAVRLVARLGGFLNRRGDGEPGVKCLWRGWQELQAMVKGYRLGLQLSSP